MFKLSWKAGLFFSALLGVLSACSLPIPPLTRSCRNVQTNYEMGLFHCQVFPIDMYTHERLSLNSFEEPELLTEFELVQAEKDHATILYSNNITRTLKSGDVIWTNNTIVARVVEVSQGAVVFLVPYHTINVWSHSQQNVRPANSNLVQTLQQYRMYARVATVVNVKPDVCIGGVMSSRFEGTNRIAKIDQTAVYFVQFPYQTSVGQPIFLRDVHDYELNKTEMAALLLGISWDKFDLTSEATLLWFNPDPDVTCDESR